MRVGGTDHVRARGVADQRRLGRIEAELEREQLARSPDAVRVLARRRPALLAADLLNEAEPFNCVRCAKPFGTLRAIESMVAKLSGHAMFQGRAAERLQMCGDCRVIDLHSDPGEVRITEL